MMNPTNVSAQNWNKLKRLKQILFYCSLMFLVCFSSENKASAACPRPLEQTTEG